MAKADIPQRAIDQAYELISNNSWGWPENGLDCLTDDQADHQMILAEALHNTTAELRAEVERLRELNSEAGRHPDPIAGAAWYFLHTRNPLLAHRLEDREKELTAKLAAAERERDALREALTAAKLYHEFCLERAPKMTPCWAAEHQDQIAAIDAALT